MRSFLSIPSYWTIPALAIALVMGAASAHSTNLINDGTFNASPCFSGWSGGGWSCSTTGGSLDSPQVATGISSYANTGGWNQGLSQTFADIAGTTYEVTADVRLNQANGWISIDGTKVITFGDSVGNTELDWTQFTGNFVGTGSDTIGLYVNDDPGTIGITGVYAGLPASVPEPASLGVLGLSMIGIFALRRRKISSLAI